MPKCPHCGKDVQVTLTKESKKDRIDDRIDYLTKEFAEKIGVPSDCVELAKKIVTAAREKHITWGRKPSTVAAASLYVACHLRDCPISQKELAKIAGIHPVTIATCHRKLHSHLNLQELQQT